MDKKLNEVLVIDGVRTAFGKAGEKGIFTKPALTPILTSSSIWTEPWEYI